MTEGCVDDLAGALRVNDASLSVRFESRLDASFFFRRQRWRLILERFNDVAACGQLAELGRNVLS